MKKYREFDNICNTSGQKISASVFLEQQGVLMELG